MILTIAVFVAIIIVTCALMIKVVYGATTYNFTNCYKQTGKNYIVYYCFGNPPHQKSVLYFELANP